MTQRLCCYIRPLRPTAEAPCPNLAEWEIYNEAKDPNDPGYTEACTEHVGPLLSDAPMHSIYPIKAEAPAAKS